MMLMAPGADVSSTILATQYIQRHCVFSGPFPIRSIRSVDSSRGGLVVRLRYPVELLLCDSKLTPAGTRVYLDE